MTKLTFNGVNDNNQRAGIEMELALAQNGGNAVPVVASENANDVKQRHNRFLGSITATWPGSDAFSVTWTVAEDVRRYRILILGGTAGDYVKVVEDAANEEQAEILLATASSDSDADVEYTIHFTSDTEANNFMAGWSDWVELSKDTRDDGLRRLDFLGSAAGAFTIHVEAE